VESVRKIWKNWLDGLSTISVSGFIKFPLKQGREKLLSFYVRLIQKLTKRVEGEKP